MKKFLCVLFCLLFLALPSGCKKQDTALNLYDIEVDFNEDMTANCSMKLDYTNTLNKTLEHLKFTLYPNAFSSDAKIKPISIENYLRAYENGISYGKIDIKSVTFQGENLDFNISGKDNNTLVIYLKNPLKSGQKTSVKIDFFIQLPNANFRYGYGNNTVNLTGFYPVLCPINNGEFYESVYYAVGDPFYSEVANFKVKLSVPSSYVVASSMSPTFTQISGEKTEYSYERQMVRDVAFVFSKKFNVLKQTTNGIDVFYYYFNDKTPQKSMETAVKSLNFFCKNYIKYPYKEYVFCEADFIYGGMEYPCLTLIDKDLNAFNRDYTIVHETAHQWWYGIVGVNQSENAFIDEGLTEYSTVNFFDEFNEYGKTKSELLKGVSKAYYGIRNTLDANTIKDTKMNKNLGEFTSEIEYVSIAYYRSQIMFYELDLYMKSRGFNKFLKALIDEYKYKNLDVDGLIKTAKSVKKGSAKLLENYVFNNAPTLEKIA